MATPKTGMPKGRPRVAFVHDDDRYTIAFGLARHRSGHDKTELGALRVALRFMEGSIDPSLELFMPKPGYEKRAEALQQKWKNAVLIDEAKAEKTSLLTTDILFNRAWLIEMTRAFIFAFYETASSEREEIILSCCSLVGERDYGLILGRAMWDLDVGDTRTAAIRLRRQGQAGTRFP